jgi:hypothetical protein
LEGDFTWMLDSVDFCTQWVEARAVWNKGWYNTLEQLRDIETRLPFALWGIDHDHGGELLNWHVLRYCQERRAPVQMSRSRPYHRDDNAHIEQKNWTHIRQWLGYGRFDNPEVVPLLNALTTGAWGPTAQLLLSGAETATQSARRGAGAARVRHSGYALRAAAGASASGGENDSGVAGATGEAQSV